MDIVSYRGPSRAGGVSVLIERALVSYSEHPWIYVSDCRVEKLVRGSIMPLSRLSPEIVLGHYRYCNEFLWPVMHGLGAVARYRPADHSAYRMFNMALSAQVGFANDAGGSFVHDYQLALMPEYFSDIKAAVSLFFMHIPWPAQCPKAYESQLGEVARALLRCRRVGFHTERYVTNFCSFVRNALPEYCVDAAENRIVHESGRQVELVASPAGVDFDHWQTKVTTAERFKSMPYVLSVARADYTKGVLEKIAAMRVLFRTHPELQQKIQLLLVCQPTRNGIAAFDEYWDRCYADFKAVVEEFSTEGWQPIHWITDTLGSEQLAGLYAGANMMLVTPRVDGLNLTAKEFVASTNNFRSPLILSTGAGSWQELKNHVITVNQCAPDDIASSILRGFCHESSPSNLLSLKRIVRNNTVHKWWSSMVGSQQDNARATVTDLMPKTTWRCNKNSSLKSPIPSRDN
jgi:trehalose-6-phosphate synthase